MSKISISKLFILQVMAGDFSSSVKTFSSLLSYWQLLSEEEECCQSDGKMKNSDQYQYLGNCPSTPTLTLTCDQFGLGKR